VDRLSGFDQTGAHSSMLIAGVFAGFVLITPAGNRDRPKVID